MGIEYIAQITKENYQVFKMIVSTTLPTDYEMWLRVRERGKQRAYNERSATCVEIEVSPEEFSAYCKGLKRPDFGIFSLDRSAHAKRLSQNHTRRSHV